VPAKIGPYQILDVLHGGSRPLYKVKAADGRVLALKTIAAAGLSPEMRERFTREAEICRALDQPNLVRAYDAGEADGNLYQAMDLLEGSDLSAVMASGRQFTWPEKLSIMEQVCEGLEYAHAHKLVHRDIKPANLFLEDSGRVRVLDFGMARVEESKLTKVGSALGTLNYMSPEQIRGERCTPASDVFSAGIVFFQLASGRHPFSSREYSLRQVVSAIVFEPPPKLSQICPDAPEGLEFLLNKALEKDPERRPQSGGALKQAVALCRITLDLAGSDAPPAATADPPAASPVRALQDEKTPLVPEVPKPAVAPEEQKTLVRDFKPAPLVKRNPPPTAKVAPPEPPAPRPDPPPAPRFRYCPACTSANPLSAMVCAVCNLPLVNSPVDGPGESPRPWSLYIAVAVAVLLAIALVVVLMVKG
jgi:serine/threonine protein kinase